MLLEIKEDSSELALWELDCNRFPVTQRQLKCSAPQSSEAMITSNAASTTLQHMDLTYLIQHSLST